MPLPITRAELHGYMAAYEEKRRIEEKLMHVQRATELVQGIIGPRVVALAKLGHSELRFPIYPHSTKHYLPEILEQIHISLPDITLRVAEISDEIHLMWN